MPCISNNHTALQNVLAVQNAIDGLTDSIGVAAFQQNGCSHTCGGIIQHHRQAYILYPPQRRTNRAPLCKKAPFGYDQFTVCGSKNE